MIQNNATPFTITLSDVDSKAKIAHIEMRMGEICDSTWLDLTEAASTMDLEFKPHGSSKWVPIQDSRRWWF